MFETFQPPRGAVKGWVAATAFGLWCVLGASGVFISIWKHGAADHLALVSSSPVFVLALYFLVAARGRLLTLKDVHTRLFALNALLLLPILMHCLLM